RSVLLEVTEANVVSAIRVEDPSFKTKKGVGAGNTFREVSSAYPDAAFHAGLEEGESITLAAKGFTFLFETHQVNIDWFMQNKKDMNAIHNIKVETVIVAQ
ncbi:MAG TPA: hypothetical protein VLS45_04350, partial [Methylomicrobium sp.]|nr:hypothetical protein [Methylomicrobium sp.]